MIEIPGDFDNWRIRSLSPPLDAIVEFRCCADGLSDSLADIRSMCLTTELSSVSTGIKNITAIGAVVRNGALYPADRLLIKDAVHLCHQWKVPVSKDFVLRVMNLADDEKGDFLLNPIQTDLLVVCLIADFKSVRGEDKRNLAKSCLYNVRGSWHHAAEQSGTKVIVAYGGLTEVTARHFHPHAPLLVGGELIREGVKIPQGRDEDPVCIFRNLVDERRLIEDLRSVGASALVRKDFLPVLSHGGGMNLHPHSDGLQFVVS